MSELPTEKIASVAAVRLYRNTEGIVVLAEEVRPLSLVEIGELFDQYGQMDTTCVSGFCELVRILENKFVKGNFHVSRIL